MADPMATDGASPQKKRGPPEDEKLSLEAIREVVRGGGQRNPQSRAPPQNGQGGARGDNPAGEDLGEVGSHQQPAARAATRG